MENNAITINQHIIEIHEMDEDTGRIRFKLDPIWRDPMDFFIPNVTAMEFMIRLHRMGHTEEKPMGFWSKELKAIASNSEVKRWLENSAVRFNGKPMKPKDMLNFPLYSVILFPKADRITLI